MACSTRAGSTLPKQSYTPIGKHCASKLIIFLLFIHCFSSLAAIDIFVNGNSTNPIETGTSVQPFHTIQGAIGFCNGTGAYNVFVNYDSDGTTYAGFEVLNKDCLINIYAGTDPYISNSDIGKAVVDGNLSGPVIKIVHCLNVSLNGISITNGNGQWDFTSSRGGGIYIGPDPVSSNTVTINKCRIFNNHADYGSGVCIHSEFALYDNFTCTVNESDIYNNFPDQESESNDGGGICIYAGNLFVSKSTISGNAAKGGAGISKHGGSFIAKVTIKSSIIKDNVAEYNTSAISFQGASSSTLNIDQSNIVNNINLHSYNGWQGTTILIFRTPQLRNDVIIRNTIVWNNTSAGSIHQQITTDGIGDINYGATDIDYNDIQLGFIGAHNLPPGSDPLFSDEVNFHLKWDTSVKSPCIDAGTPEAFNSMDTPTYFRHDIGAVEFNDFENRYADYTFPVYTPNDYIKWTSFPVLYSIQNNQFSNQVTAGSMFSSILQPNILTKIEWNNIYNDDNFISAIEFFNNEWTLTGETVTSQQGYRIEMSPDNTVERSIKVSGFMQDKGTPTPIYGRNQNGSVENWVGYFYPKTLSVYDAFDEIIDNLYYIKTQHWFIMRQDSRPGSPWVWRTPQPEFSFTLSPGDMAIVKSFQDVVLTWNNQAPEVPIFSPPKPQHYSFVEKIDYVPIYVDFKGSNVKLPSEIAIYVDGECKGATVVTDSLAQICAYMCDDTPAGQEVYFMLYYDDKSLGIVPDYQVWNSKTGLFTKEKLNTSDKQDYYRVNITKANTDNNVLPKLYLTNYPNPFLNDTNIKYYVPLDSKVRVSIYNTKGQLVKTLVDERNNLGMQNAIWNGKDANGVNCTNGIYFCTITCGKNTVSRKLIMIK